LTNFYFPVFATATLTLALVLSLTISGDSIFIPKNYPNVYIEENCAVTFSKSNPSQVDAFSLNQSTWTSLSDRCKKNWKAAHAQEFKTVTLTATDDVTSALHNAKVSVSYYKRSVKLVTLFGYNNVVDLNHTLKFFAAISNKTSKDLLVQNSIDIFNRMANFNQLQHAMVLPFWEIILKVGLDVELNFTSLLNNSQSAVINNICNFFIDPTLNEHHKNNAVEFSNLNYDSKVFFMPKLISTCYINSSYSKRFIKYVKSMTNVACVGFNEIYLLLQSENKLETTDAFELKTAAAEDITQDAELCEKVVNNLELYPHSLFHMFSKMFDNKSYNLAELKADAFKLSSALIPELVLKRYNGSAINGARLAEFLWDSFDNDRIDFICNSTHLLMQQMKVYHKLKSFHALVLFTYLRNEETDGQRFPRDFSYFIFETAPGIVTSFMFASQVCNCCDVKLGSELCIDNAINEIDAILLEHGTSDDVNVTYPHQVMFLGYVLHSLMNSRAINNSASIAKKVISTQKQFNATYKNLFNEFMNDFFNQSNTPSISLETLWFNKRFYFYFSQLMFRNAFALFGLTKMSSMIIRLERFLDNKNKRTYVFCHCAKLVYTEMASKQSLILIDEAYALYLYLEHHIDKSYNNQFNDSHTVLWGSSGTSACFKTHKNLKKIVQTQLNYFVHTWNNLTLQPRLLQWHKKFELSSAWLLPKLVRHVLDNNSTNLMELLEFFSVLEKQSYSEPLSLCPGLYELVLQVLRKQPNYFMDVILKKILKMIPPIKKRTASDVGVSNRTYDLYEKKCRVVTTTIFKFIDNKVV